MSTMDETSRRTLDQALGEEFVADLGSLDLEELRRRREFAEQEENLLSYERRLLQGRRDLLAFEVERRAGREGRSLIEALPDILGGERHSGRPARQGVLPDPEMPDERRRKLDRILADDVIARLGDVDDEELQKSVADLEAAEREVSEQRHRLHAVIDALHEELAARYRSGAELG
ncbi:MAG TPA: ABC transporter substrate-binding protein [Acidimicrobiia bacterium]|nr:ABC transporter substrate-binding protein [Acidimicrobiia bacterium]